MVNRCRSPQSSAFTTTTGTGRSPGRRARAARPPTVSSGKANILIAPFFEQLHQVGHGLVAQPPVAAKGVGRAIRLDGIVPHGIGRVPRLVPPGAGQAEDVLDGEIAFEVGEHRGLDPRLGALARERVLAELEIVEHEVGVAEQVVHGAVQAVGEGDEHAAARHGLVALVLADGLRRDAVADRPGEAAQREPRGRARQLQPLSDHSAPSC